MPREDVTPLRLDAVELRRIELPLVSPFRTSFGTETARDILLVRVVAEDVVGWGECVAGNEPLYSSEYVEACQHVSQHHLIPRLFAHDRGRVSAQQVAKILEPVKDHRMSKGAIEAAVLDAQLRACGTNFATHLGAVRATVPSGLSSSLGTPWIPDRWHSALRSRWAR